MSIRIFIISPFSSALTNYVFPNCTYFVEVIIIDIVDRIFELVAQQFKEQKDFAAALDVPAPRVSEWRRRKSNSYQRCLPEIAQVLNTSTEYLLTGTGPKTKKAPASASVSEDDIKAAFFEGAEDLSPEEMAALWDDARDYMRYKLEQRRKQKQ